MRTIYVSFADGDDRNLDGDAHDKNGGTKDKPFASVAHAQFIGSADPDEYEIVELD